MDTYLAHYGILGMKWGVRRYQNEDGTLTELGKHHVRARNSVNSNIEKVATSAQKFSKSTAAAARTMQNAKAIDAVKKKSNDELIKENTRAKLERTNLQNQNITANNQNGQDTDTGTSSFFKALADASGITAAKYEKIANAEAAKKAKTMSDAELRSAINRMQLEDQYRNLSKKDRESGADYVYNFRKETLNDVVTYTTAIAAVISPIIIKKLK